jgi:hypothetical protein
VLALVVRALELGRGLERLQAAFGRLRRSPRHERGRPRSANASIECEPDAARSNV